MTISRLFQLVILIMLLSSKTLKREVREVLLLLTNNEKKFEIRTLDPWKEWSLLEKLVSLKQHHYLTFPWQIARDEMMKNRNGKGLRRLKGIFNIREPGESVSVDDGKPHVGEKLKVTWKNIILTTQTRNPIVVHVPCCCSELFFLIVVIFVHIYRKSRQQMLEKKQKLSQVC